jgi:signal transduction histidine kinase
MGIQSARVRVKVLARREAPLRIRSNLLWLTATGFWGLAVFAAVAFMVLSRIEVNGPVYQQISLSTDLVRDYVPPPESLLQAALVCSQISETSDPAERQRYLSLFRASEKDFEQKHADYMRRVPEGKLKEMMRGTAYETAEQYFQIAEREFIPLAMQGDREKAEQVLVSTMNPLYVKHAAAVDQIVETTNEEARSGEALAAKIVHFYTEVMVAVGLLILIAGGVFSVAIARDISTQTKELQRSFQQLRALAAQLQIVREAERKRLAREIHDQLGQALTAIRIDVSSLILELPEGWEQQPERTSSVLKLVDETIQSVRRISTELRPGILDDLGLVAAVEWAAEEFQTRTGTKCRIDLPQDDIAIDPEKATAIFRIFQETLTNIARHAHASEVKARLTIENGDLTLEVHDNGRGIPEGELQKAEALGILGMRERALLFGGELTIAGVPGKGTAVRVRIPEASGTILEST